MKNLLAAAGIGTGSLMLTAPAMAAIPVEVTDAFTSLNADLVTVGGLVVVATVGVAVWKYVQALIV